MLHGRGAFLRNPITEIVSLSGTSVSPVTMTVIETSPADATSDIAFESNGNITSLSGYAVATEWCNTTPGSTYYLRVTSFSQSGPGTRTGPVGWTSGSVLALTTNRIWTIVNTSNLLSTGSWVLKCEIANNSGMTNILATGYYDIRAAVDTGGGN